MDSHLIINLCIDQILIFNSYVNCACMFVWHNAQFSDFSGQQDEFNGFSYQHIENKLKNKICFVRLAYKRIFKVLGIVIYQYINERLLKLNEINILSSEPLETRDKRKCHK